MNLSTRFKILLFVLSIASIETGAQSRQLPVPAPPLVDRPTDHTLSSPEWAARAVSEYNTDLAGERITYVTANGTDVQLDLYRRKDKTGPQPTLIYFHGGGWGAGSRNSILYLLFPWFEMGFNIVNVEYRLTRVAKAPAAVQDGLCALRWVATHAEEYNFDLKKIVVSGESSGGHLALTTGMIPESAGMDTECPGAPLPKAAAIVDFYGITDLPDLLKSSGRNWPWIPEGADRNKIAKEVSPTSYIAPGLPPILIIHGDADPIVPYSQSVSFDAALQKANVSHQFITVPNGKHGNFTSDDYVNVYSGVRSFLRKYDLLPK